MTLSVKLEKENIPEWDAYVNSHPQATNYHQYAWKKVIEESFGHEGLFLSARKESGAICGILPLIHMKSRLFGDFLVSLPFLNYGGVLCDDLSCEEVLLEEAQKLKTRLNVGSVELRHLNRKCAELTTKSHKVTMILDLAQNEEDQWKKFDPKVRNQVRKAEKNGLQVISGRMELLNGFYEVFCRNMRDLGTPVYGKEFFQNVLDTFPASTRILSVTLNGRTIASGFMAWFKDTVEVPWASSSRDHLDLCPNNLLYWEAIKLGVCTGAKKFDFGRSTPGGGTYRFKKQWGAESVPLYWQYLVAEGSSMPELNPSNPKYRLAIEVWKRLPIGVTKFMGPRIVRSIP